MTQWEYVKGSEADFEGAPEWAAQVVKHDNGNGSAYTEKLSPLDSFSTGSAGWKITAQRRKVDNLQSRVNDANLGDALKEMFIEQGVVDARAYRDDFDTVQRPAHYNQSGIECIDAIAASMTPAEFQAYLKGNVQKYLWRYQHKNGVEDCRKAQWYLDRLIKELSK